MHDFGGVVKDPAKAMTTEVADNAVPEFFRMPLDRIADVAHGIPGLCLLDAQHHAFISHFNQTPRIDRRVPDDQPPAGDPVPAVHHDGAVDLDGVAVLYPL